MSDLSYFVENQDVRHVRRDLERLGISFTARVWQQRTEQTPTVMEFRIDADDAEKARAVFPDNEGEK